MSYQQRSVANRFLAIYLRDHHAGGCAGAALARRAAELAEPPSSREELELVARQVAEDHVSLEEIMAAFGVAPNTAKDRLARIGERVGRLKLNGRLVNRSPLSTVVELEFLVSGISAKAAMWRALAIGGHPQLEGIDLDRLLERAERQRHTVESCRLDAARIAFVDAA